MSAQEKRPYLIGRWVSFVRSNAIVVLTLACLLAVLAARYSVNNIRMNTDTEDMLSAELAWRKLDQAYEKLFPQYDNNILVVLEAATPDQARDAAALLYERLQAEQALFEFVYYPRALPVFTESGLLYLSEEELQDLSDRLAEMQPFLARLARDPSLAGLFGTLGEALDAIEDGEPVNIDPVLIRINAALEALRDNRPYRLSWQELMSAERRDGAEAGKTRHREFIVLQPKLDYADFFPATAAIDKIRRIHDELNIASTPGAALRLTGAVTLAHEEMLSVTKGAGSAVVLALALVTVIMLTGLGSVRLALATVISLAIGLTLTAAFAILTVGELNLISVAFAVLYIGLGVDFAIHYCLRYQEHLSDGVDSGAALEQTSINVGGSLFLCAVSTAIGFFAFIPTHYSGVAELGWISGVGMFISFTVTLTVIPALLSLLPGKAARAPAAGAGASGLVDRHAGKILGLAACLALTSALLLTGLRFDHNPLNLHDQDGAALTAYRELLADNELTPWTAIMIAADAGEADRYRQLLGESELVDKVVTVADFIPAGQDEKLSVIDEMSLLLGDISAAAQPDPETQTRAARAVALRAFLQKLQARGADDPARAALIDNLSGLLAQPDPTAQAAMLEQLEQALLASLPGRLDALNTSLNADYISLETLPAQLERLWLGADGQRRIEIYPRQDLQDNAALRAFVREIQSISPEVTGAPVINLEASDAVAAAFRQAFLYAFGAITLMLYILLARKKDVILALIPLLCAALITGAVSALLGLPLNFANVIALPLLLGIGVDSAIHIIHRFRTDLPDGKNILSTSSARAVIVSSLTTMGGVGNLALSPHAGTASMGLLLTLGIGVTLVCMLLILPALLVADARGGLSLTRRANTGQQE